MEVRDPHIIVIRLFNKQWHPSGAKKDRMKASLRPLENPLVMNVTHYRLLPLCIDRLTVAKRILVPNRQYMITMLAVNRQSRNFPMMSLGCPLLKRVFR